MNCSLWKWNDDLVMARDTNFLFHRIDLSPIFVPFFFTSN